MTHMKPVSKIANFIHEYLRASAVLFLTTSEYGPGRDPCIRT